MARGAVVVILSDGWERADPTLVGREMERLARLAHRIVWVNPRASAPGFSPAAGGMAAALPHCDALVSGHCLDALDEVAEAMRPTNPSRSGLERAGTDRGRGAVVAQRRADRGAEAGSDAQRVQPQPREDHRVTGSGPAMPRGARVSRDKARTRRGR